MSKADQVDARERPLEGWRIVVTRAREQARVLSDALRQLGAEPVEIPAIEIRDPPSWEPMDNAIARLKEFHFLLLTSANGVRKFLGRLRLGNRDIGDLSHLEVGAIGPATAAELTQRGVRVAFVPREYRAEGLLAALEGRDVQGRAFLIPRARVARDLVPRVLRERGATVEVVPAYETVTPVFAPGELERLLSPPPHMLTFTSSSAAAHFFSLLARHRLADRVSASAISSIGPVTSAALRELGLTVDLEARDFTIRGLVEAILQYRRRLATPQPHSAARSLGP